MNPRNKIWIALLAFALVTITIACSCSSLTDLFGSKEPMPGLAGQWEDPLEGTIHTIEWNGDTYVVTSSVNPDNGTYAVSDQNWDGSTFTWTYYVAASDVSVTIQALSISGDTMSLNWWSTNGNSGQDTFNRYNP
jgi:hypothetical protein